MQINYAFEGDKQIRALNMPHLKKHNNAEWNTFIKFSQKESRDHHVEAKFNQFCQFVYDGATLNNKQKL